MTKFDSCDEVQTKFNKVSSDLQTMLKAQGGDATVTEMKTSEVNNELNDRRNRLYNRRNLVKDVERVEDRFRNVAVEVNDWNETVKKDLEKKEPVAKEMKNADVEIQEIDVSLSSYR